MRRDQKKQEKIEHEFLATHFEKALKNNFGGFQQKDLFSIWSGDVCASYNYTIKYDEAWYTISYSSLFKDGSLFYNIVCYDDMSGYYKAGFRKPSNDFCVFEAMDENVGMDHIISDTTGDLQMEKIPMTYDQAMADTIIKQLRVKLDDK